ncbi:shikimate dehydrogenase family protein [Dyadobacter tibetensis]|uniref:shikimate dehydrogenase family protein n=1 Tax=Dyadobacter tibetensis TaxID=1211851 RepID=UPI000471488E|nr:shikimate dehydrogenase [Dyadobacter tibetensis]
MNIYGLIGFPLTHSFSKRYFTDKFEREGIKESIYNLNEMETLDGLLDFIKNTPELRGLNVTIPHKKNVVQYLDDLDEASAERIGAVNTIKIYADGSTKGFNTDYYGFKQSLEEWFDKRGEDCEGIKALVLGDGGAAKAVKVALEDLHIPFHIVSRSKSEHTLQYEELTEEIIKNHRLIVNTTPLGTYPNTDSFPDLPYQWITTGHYLYDLVYNPAETQFLKKGMAMGAQGLNGLKMLEMQAEKSWNIWVHEDSLWSV